LLVHQEGLKFVKFASILLLEISREERAIKTRDIGRVSYPLRSITTALTWRLALPRRSHCPELQGCKPTTI